MRVAKIPFSRQAMFLSGGIPSSLFKEVLDSLPKDTTIIGCGFDGQYCVDYLFIQSQSFKDVKEGQYIPHITPYFIKLNDGTSKLDKIDYEDVLDTSLPCNHVWKSYFGLQDSTEYCTICNTRRDK